MLTQHEYDNISSQKSCYSSDTNATVSVVQRYLTTTIVSSSRVQNSIPEIKVESCTREFLAQHFNDVRKKNFFFFEKKNLLDY
jgi:hypothetical protein